MEIPVSSILQSPNSVNRHDFHERIELSSGEEKLVEPVDGEVIVTRASSRIIQTSGNFHTRLKLNCHRCGNEFEQSVDFNLDETLEVIDGPITSEEVEDVVSAQGDLDVTDLIRQSLLLSLPARHLCGCEPSDQLLGKGTVDPRWAALKTLTPDPADSN